MPFEPFTPPPVSPPVRWVPTPMPPPPPSYTVVSPIPGTVAQPRRKRRWWLWLIVALAFLLFEPVRIMGCVLIFFWICAIGMMPHVAVLKTVVGRDRQ